MRYFGGSSGTNLPRESLLLYALRGKEFTTIYFIFPPPCVLREACNQSRASSLRHGRQDGLAGVNSTKPPHTFVQAFYACLYSLPFMSQQSCTDGARGESSSSRVAQVICNSVESSPGPNGLSFVASIITTTHRRSSPKCRGWT